MAEYYRSICELTLKYRDSKEVVVRKAVITLVPSMATYDSDEFEQHYLHRSMAYLLQALNKATDRDIGGYIHHVDSQSLLLAAYVALGHLSLQLGSKMRPFIDDTIKVVKDHLRQRG
jgi:FKBP12-rapamycin complex-associated protein